MTHSRRQYVRRLLRKLIEQMRRDKCHRRMRHSIEKVLREAWK